MRYALSVDFCRLRLLLYATDDFRQCSPAKLLDRKLSCKHAGGWEGVAVAPIRNDIGRIFRVLLDLAA